MLKKRDLYDVPALFELSIDPEVYPYLRHKAATLDEFYFLTKQILEAEQVGSLISRTILNELGQPIGTINLYDIHNRAGFLATWIGRPYFGKGYNKIAKRLFFKELFFDRDDIETIFLKVNKANIRSRRAVEKLGYAQFAKDMFPDVYRSINLIEERYDLYVVTKEHYASHLQFADITDELNESNNAEVVS